MLKKLLIFFRIIDEIYIPAPISRGDQSERKTVKPQKNFIPEKTVFPEQTALADENPAIKVNSKIKPVRKEKIKSLSEHTRDYKDYCLEKTSNQHMMKTSSYKVIDRNGSTETFFIQDDAFITHKEHKMLRVESQYFVKYIQQEYNPITQVNENAYD
ncbi:MAG: hypothetical protein LBE92_21385 [Chryseobacterium sp.]|jgi:hypothetical protein|uniref:hypothetical protein n=1 Tax=Chryseobacterium sp. TaxID=1871047 RepID=UPI00281B9ADF|nr:hypothetical protein [Chryseobacterium sp.]MDR2238679.1 hypothetical protein [Chryseobacterium sp.]